MLTISIYEIANMTPAELESVLSSLSIPKSTFAQKLMARHYECERLIGMASSIQGDAYTTKRAVLACEKLAGESDLCKRIAESLGHKEERQLRAFSKSEIRRMVSEQAAARREEAKKAFDDLQIN
jgi:hypothetical protein